MKRIEMTPKDVVQITAKSERYGREQIKKIKLHYKKQPHQILTIEEYCQYSGLDYQNILIFLNAHR